MSLTEHRRESPDSKRQRIEETAIKVAIENSISDAMEYKTQVGFRDLQELSRKLKLDKYWDIIHKEPYLLISHISLSPFPNMMMSVLINPDKSVQAYIDNVPVRRLHHYVIPSHVQDINTIEVMLQEMRKYDRQSSSSMNPLAIIQLILTFLATTIQAFNDFEIYL